MAKDIYCHDCEYFESGHPVEAIFGSDGNLCRHPSNLRFKKRWNFLQVTYKHNPKRLNRKNNCLNFSKKLGLDELEDENG